MEKKKLALPSIVSLLVTISILSGCTISGGVLTARWEHVDDAATVVKLFGNYLVIDEIEEFNVGFVWDTEKHASWKKYSSDFVEADGFGLLNSFHISVYSLDRTITYHYRAIGEFVVDGKSRWFQSLDRTFTPGLPEVSTRKADDIGHSSAVLHGRLAHMGGATSCDVWFEYDEQNSDESPPNHYGFSTDPQKIDATGDFSSLIKNLKSNTTYCFHAVASNDVGKDYGLRLNFTTLP